MAKGQTANPYFYLMEINPVKTNGRYKCTHKGVVYHLTFEQLNAIKQKGNKDAYYDAESFFNSLPAKEKKYVRPDWKPDDGYDFYPDPVYEE